MCTLIIVFGTVVSELALRLEMMHLRFSDAPQFWQRQSVKAIGQGRKQKEGVQELKSRKRLAKGDVDQGLAPGFSGVHGGSYGFQRTADQAPSAVTENYNRKRSALQILLEAKIFVGCEQYFKSSLFGDLQ